MIDTQTPRFIHIALLGCGLGLVTLGLSGCVNFPGYGYGPHDYGQSAYDHASGPFGFDNGYGGHEGDHDGDRDGNGDHDSDNGHDGDHDAR